MQETTALRVASVPMSGIRSVPNTSALIIDPKGQVRAVYHKLSEGRRYWLLADIDPRRTQAPTRADRYTVGAPWTDILRFYQENRVVKKFLVFVLRPRKQASS